MHDSCREDFERHLAEYLDVYRPQTHEDREAISRIFQTAWAWKHILTVGDHSLSVVAQNGAARVSKRFINTSPHN
jgi:hypothetical protein